MADKLRQYYDVLCVNGGNANILREDILNNFSTNTKQQSDEFNVLITTDVLSEGISLQRANVIVNYDIPWNPTRMMQRIGRINRVDSIASELFVYNFFPTDESNEEIKLTENAKTKIAVFIELLGTDSHTLTEDEILGGKKMFGAGSGIDDNIYSEDESELEYLNEIKQLRDENPNLFEIIKKLPKKCKTQRKKDLRYLPALLTYFKQGGLKKCIMSKNNNETIELNFIETARMLKADPEDKIIKGVINEVYFELLSRNKLFYQELIHITDFDVASRGSKDAVNRLLHILKAVVKDTKQFTDTQESHYLQFKNQLTLGNIPKELAKTILKQIKDIIDERKMILPLEILDALIETVPNSFFKDHRGKVDNFKNHPQEVILSEYFVD